MDFKDLTIKEASEALAEKEVSAVELAEYYLGVIKEKEPEVHAFINVFNEAAGEAAKEADEQIKKGVSVPLLGIPVAVKDNILVRGYPATAGSKILEDYQASYDATVVKKLKSAGAVIVGKTNLDEFAMGSSTENSAYGPTKNPHDTSRAPGGSSGGSAAAVAANMCLGALGSDTGGSIRQPASFCGVVGMKPTYGAVSRYGLIALASSLDQIGPLAKTVSDAALLYNVISGHDPLDSTALRDDKEDKVQKNIQELVIGVPREYFEAKGLDPTVGEIVRSAIAWYESQGAKVEELSLPHTAFGLSTYYIVMPAEASANLARYDGVRYGLSRRRPELWESYRLSRGEGFGPEPIRRIMTGTYVLSAGYYDAYYKKAKATQQRIKAEFGEAFKKVNIIMTPTAPTVAFKLGEKTADPLAMYAADIFTVPVNIAGLPAISVPCGQKEGLPVGLQIIAPWGCEDILFEAALLFEQGHNHTL